MALNILKCEKHRAAFLQRLKGIAILHPFPRRKGARTKIAWKEWKNLQMFCVNGSMRTVCHQIYGSCVITSFPTSPLQLKGTWILKANVCPSQKQRRETTHLFSKLFKWEPWLAHEAPYVGFVFQDETEKSRLSSEHLRPGFTSVAGGGGSAGKYLIVLYIFLTTSCQLEFISGCLNLLTQGSFDKDNFVAWIPNFHDFACLQLFHLSRRYWHVLLRWGLGICAVPNGFSSSTG